MHRQVLRTGVRRWTAVRCICPRQLSSHVVNSLLPVHDEFISRHIGPRERDQDVMLKELGFKVSPRGFTWVSKLLLSLWIRALGFCWISGVGSACDPSRSVLTNPNDLAGHFGNAP
ncbi:hypothetical protein CEXT_751471 [Caerostris extrusa]|uniref:Uncharacterized protein n=1 Tax=Caerostris extrusa TaxID=172846 RepID=A0AAV4N6F7_CAEEX|nr:hypothetical protein CEXT_751471 [Caerostris extrusa]